MYIVQGRWRCFIYMDVLHKSNLSNMLYIRQLEVKSFQILILTFIFSGLWQICPSLNTSLYLNIYIVQNQTTKTHAFLACFDITWCTPKLLDGFNYESKGEDNKRRRSWSVLLSSQHFGGIGACWSFEMGIRKIDKQVNYSHRPTQTKLQVG